MYGAPSVYVMKSISYIYLDFLTQSNEKDKQEKNQILYNLLIRHVDNIK